MTLEGVDGEGVPGPVILKANGKSFAVVYTKFTDAAQVRNWLNGGIDLVIVFESTGHDFTGGEKQGQEDATAANNWANSVGLSGAPIYFAIDMETTDYTAVDLYLRGCGLVIGLERVGVYGSYAICTAVIAAGVATYHWQTYAWSDGQLNGEVNLYQYDNDVNIEGFSVDLDRTVVSDTNFGQWKALQPPVQELTFLPTVGKPGPFGPAKFERIGANVFWHIPSPEVLKELLKKNPKMEVFALSPAQDAEIEPKLKAGVTTLTGAVG